MFIIAFFGVGLDGPSYRKILNQGHCIDAIVTAMTTT